MSKTANYRYAGCRGNCCAICQYNQRNNEAEDYCELGEAPWPFGSDDEHVCDSFKLEAHSIPLQDIQVGMELEYDLDEPYRGNAYAGPFLVHNIRPSGFTYLVNGKEVHKFAPFRGYKRVQP